MLNRLKGIISNLVVHARKMEENLNLLRGLIYSQQVMIRLMAKGVQRRSAYEMVQRNALKVWNEGREFKEVISEDPEILNYLNKKDIDELISLDYHLKHVEDIFDRVFKKDSL